jgi:hypothetical protein
MTPAQTDEAITVKYTNWRGETDVRMLLLGEVRYGTTEWHPEPTHLISAFDLNHPAQIWKEYDLSKMDFTRAAMQPSVADAAKVLLNALGNEYGPKCPIWGRIIDAIMSDRIGMKVRGSDGILIALRALSKETPDA